MTSKTIIIGLVALAFVAGSIMTGTMAEAKKEDKNKGNPFQAILDAIDDLQSQIVTIELTSDLGDTYITTETTTIIAGLGGNGVAQCDEGDVLLSGGYIFFGADLIVTADQPIPVGADGQGWQVGAVNPDTTDGTIIIKIICANTTP